MWHSVITCDMYIKDNIHTRVILDSISIFLSINQFIALGIFGLYTFFMKYDNIVAYNYNIISIVNLLWHIIPLICLLGTYSKFSYIPFIFFLSSSNFYSTIFESNIFIFSMQTRQWYLAYLCCLYVLYNCILSTTEL